MGHNCFMIISAFLILLSATTNPSVEAITIPSLPVVVDNILSITGQVCCTNTGNCPGPAVSGATVFVICTNSFLGPNVTIGQGVTDVDGVFDIAISLAGSLLNAADLVTSLITTCTADIQLPLPSTVCSQLSQATAILQATLVLVSTVTGTVGTTVATVFNIITGVFVLL